MDACPEKWTKKYLTRESPPRPANDPNCRDSVFYGNDGELWQSVENANGVYRWVPLATLNKSIEKKSAKKKSAKKSANKKSVNKKSAKKSANKKSANKKSAKKKSVKKKSVKKKSAKKKSAKKKSTKKKSTKKKSSIKKKSAKKSQSPENPNDGSSLFVVYDVGDRGGDLPRMAAMPSTWRWLGAGGYWDARYPFEIQYIGNKRQLMKAREVLDKYFSKIKHKGFIKRFKVLRKLRP